MFEMPYKAINVAVDVLKLPQRGFSPPNWVNTK